MRTMRQLMTALLLMVSIEAYATSPTITGFSPASGPVGTLVTITGTNLSSPTAFTIGGVPAIAVSNTGNTLVGMVMPGSATGSVSITTSGGTATGSGSFAVMPTLYPGVQQDTLPVGTGVVGRSYQGMSVSLSADGNTAIIGGFADASYTSTAWVYSRSGGIWTQQGPKLVGTGAIISSQGLAQGTSVSLSADGNTAIVGAPRDNNDTGAVWIYTRTGSTWTQQGGKLVGTGVTGYAPALQGTSVSLSADGNTAIVGGPNDGAVVGLSLGAAWIFTRSGGIWTQQGPKLVGSGSSTGTVYVLQGESVALSADGNTAMIGGPFNNQQKGAVWVYTRSGTTWTQDPSSPLVGSGSVDSSFQGCSIALSADGNTAIVGGWQDNNSIGAAWVYTRSGGFWTQQGGKLVGTGAVGTPVQGQSVSLSADGNTAIVGGAGDNSGKGAVWVFTRSGGGIWTQRGTKLVGAGGIGNGGQGFAVSLSADGKTTMVCGPSDDAHIGKTWVFGPCVICNPLSLADTVVNATCFGTNTGTVYVYPYGGFSPYQYKKAGGSYQANNIFDSLAAGTYTFYVKDSTGAVDSITAAVSTNLNVTPSVSITGSSVTSCITIDTFTAVAIYGGTAPSYRWYKDGQAVGTNSPTYIPASLTASDTVIDVVMTSNLACASPAIAADTLHIIILPTPAAPMLTLLGGCLGHDSLELTGGTSALQLNWYLNGSLIHTTSVPTYTVAGGNGPGTAADQLYQPYGIFVDGSGNLYVADQYNNRIQKFPAGSTSATNGVTVAGGIGYGSAAYQIHGPLGVWVDAGGNIYVDDVGNERIQKFPSGSSSSTNATTVAGSTGTGGNAANLLNYPTGIYVDGSGNLYVADEFNERIQKFPAGSTSATNGVTVAGGNYGSGANQLNGAAGVFVDASGNIYVADYFNNRVQKFPAGSTSATNGVTVAGGNGPGSGANQLYYPSGIYVDGIGNIYVADYLNNRIQKFPAGSTSATNGVTVAGGTVAGSGATQLYNPTDVFVDGSGNIYVADKGNNRIQKYPISITNNIDSIYTPATAGNYTATIVGANGCPSPLSNSIPVTTCLDTVWPGDADANRMVDNNDLLTIGLGYGSTGPVRTVQGIVWQGDAATDWTNYFTIYAPTVNFNHADCNGDGIINADDTLAIVTNFGDIHAKTSGLPGPWRSGTPGISLLFSKDTVTNGDTLTTSIILGSSTVPVNNIYGLAFTFHYDTRVDTLTSFTFVPSWLGTAANSININRNFTSTGAVKAAITGIDHTPRSGSGEIATFTAVITTGNINGKNLSYYPSVMYLSDIRAIDQYGDTIPLNAGIDSNYVAFTPNGIRDISQTAKVNIYPNPASTHVMVTSGTAMSAISISDMQGKEVRMISVSNKLNEAIDISALDDGVYIIRVSTVSGTATAKLVVSR